MITLKTGDLLQSEMHCLVNPVNCVGIMGKGLALQFKQANPHMFETYRSLCERKLIAPQQLLQYVPSDDGKHDICLFPTKVHWRDKSNISDIEETLKYLSADIFLGVASSLALPLVGCGLGGLDWHDVVPIIYRLLDKVYLPVELYVPDNVMKELEEV